MFIAVDEVKPVDGFCYTNKDGNEEKVVLNGKSHWCSVVTALGYDSVRVYYNDIPKLVKALEAAKKHYEEVINA